MDEKQKRDLREAKIIREKYIPEKKRTEDKMTTLRSLDASAERPGKVAALSIGIISVLLLGVGMCCTMLWAERLFVVGVIVGIAGLVGIAASYPISVHITKKKRQRIADEVLRIADEIIESCE